MKIILYGQTACEWWLRAKSNPFAAPLQHIPSLANCSPTAASMEYLEREFPFLPKPYHVLVFSHDDLRTLAHTKTHISNNRSHKKLIRAISHGIYVVSPELSLLQAACNTNAHELIMYAYAFCGTYAISTQVDTSPINRDPLTNLRQLKKLAQSHSPHQGSRLLAKTLPLVLENAASPQEALLAMKLTLPYRLGGFNLKQPQLNYRILLSKYAEKFADRLLYKADECWPREKLIVEYDSNRFHLSPEQKRHDEIRRCALERSGYKVIVVTQQQASNPAELRKVADQIASHLKMRVRPQSQRFHENQQLLFSRELPY